MPQESYKKKKSTVTVCIKKNIELGLVQVLQVPSHAGMSNKGWQPSTNEKDGQVDPKVPFSSRILDFHAMKW